jgi:Fe-S-cluster containining protein
LSIARLVTRRELLRLVQTKNFDYSQGLRREYERIQPNQKITCADGCSFCCYAKILVDAGTGAILYMHLERKGEWTPALEAKLLAADKALTASTHAEWLGKSIPCALLDEESPGRGRCTVYAVRPIACVSAHSVTSDPELCAEVDGSAQFLLHSAPFAQTIAEVCKSVMRSVGETDTGIMTLPGAVLYGRAMIEGLPRPDVRRLSWDQWDSEGRGKTLDELFDPPFL